jgi:general secretion pathway protein A
MFSSFYKLKINPFGETPDSRFYFKSDSHQAALKDLAWMITQGKGFALLTGDVGTGKTLLCRMLLKVLSARAHTALILHPMLNGPELLETIADDFQISKTSQAPMTTKMRLDQLNAFLMKNALNRRKSVLIIDDAQCLNAESLEMVRILSNLETESSKLLQIILVGQPELKDTLQKPELRQLGQRISVAPSLVAFNVAQVEEYIQYRIEVAGGGNFVRFQPKALNAIFEASKGVPRLINKYCEAALEIGKESNSRLISPEIVSDAIKSSGGIEVIPKKRSWPWKGEGKAS